MVQFIFQLYAIAFSYINVLVEWNSQMSLGTCALLAPVKQLRPEAVISLYSSISPEPGTQWACNICLYELPFLMLFFSQKSSLFIFTYITSVLQGLIQISWVTTIHQQSTSSHSTIMHQSCSVYICCVDIYYCPYALICKWHWGQCRMFYSILFPTMPRYCFNYLNYQWLDGDWTNMTNKIIFIICCFVIIKKRRKKNYPVSVHANLLSLLSFWVSPCLVPSSLSDMTFGSCWSHRRLLIIPWTCPINSYPYSFTEVFFTLVQFLTSFHLLKPYFSSHLSSPNLSGALHDDFCNVSSLSLRKEKLMHLI